MDLTIYIYILVTLLFSAFFSGMEIAFVSANKLRLEMERHSRSLTTYILSIFYRKPNDFISTLLVGNNIALVIYGILMAEVIEHYILANLIGSVVLLVLTETVISTLLIIVAGEFLPKMLFKLNPNNTLQIFAVPALLCYVILFPVSKCTSGLAWGLLRLVGVTLNREATAKAFTKVDLDDLIEQSITENTQALDTEVQIFRNALDFSNVRIRDCIVPRTEIKAIEIYAPLEQLQELFIETGLSKIIVYQDHIDNIIGYVHSAEMFRNAQTWTQHIQQMPIVPETMGAQKLMQLFMKQKKSLAVVVDEFGGTAGIVSLEDLVEEIIGEIEDEHDTNSYTAKEIAPSEYLLSARLEIARVNEMFSLHLPESDEYLTIGGLILHTYQSFPKLNEEVRVGNFLFRIVKISATKIELVRLKVTE